MEIHRDIERTARFGLGAKIDILFLDLLELLRKAVWAQVGKKIIILQEALEKIDALRFFLQLLWEARLMSNNSYTFLATDIEDLGRIIGGWKKGLVNKTSALKAEERK